MKPVQLRHGWRPGADIRRFVLENEKRNAYSRSATAQNLLDFLDSTANISIGRVKV